MIMFYIVFIIIVNTIIMNMNVCNIICYAYYKYSKNILALVYCSECYDYSQLHLKIHY